MKKRQRSGSLFFWLALLFLLLVSQPGRGQPSPEEALQPLVTTAELITGANRFAFGLLKAGKLIDHADVTLRLYAIDGGQPSLTAESKVPYATVRQVAPQPSLHRHADGRAHLHDSESLVRGLYVTQLTLSRVGDWGIELQVSQSGGQPEIVRFAITSRDSSPTPAIGSAAPRSRNLIARDVKDLRQIDSSSKPDPRLHQVRIADAIAQGRPQLIVFATPQFCTSRMCGPVVDIVRDLLPRYGKQLAFVHQEIWQNFVAKKPFATVAEWRLATEPWIFLVDGQGIIRARFEGLVTTRELEEAVQLVLPKSPGSR